jgi:hypothetical protein
MCDQEERREDNKRYWRGYGKPLTMNCDQCTKLLPRQNIKENWKDTGWNVCEFCIDDLPDFVLEYIEILEARIIELETDQ